MPRKKILPPDKFIDQRERIKKITGIEPKRIREIKEDEMVENLSRYVKKRLKQKIGLEKIDQELSRMAVSIAVKKTAQLFGIKPERAIFEVILRKYDKVMQAQELEENIEELKEKMKKTKNPKERIGIEQEIRNINMEIGLRGDDFKNTLKIKLTPLAGGVKFEEVEPVFWAYFEKLKRIVRICIMLEGKT